MKHFLSSIFVLGLALPTAHSAGGAGPVPGSLRGGVLTPIASVVQAYPGWGNAVSYLASSQGGILNQFELDFSQGGKFAFAGGESPLRRLTRDLQGMKERAEDPRSPYYDYAKNMKADWATHPDMEIIKKMASVLIREHMKSLVQMQLRVLAARADAYKYANHPHRPSDIENFREVVEKLKHLMKAYETFMPSVDAESKVRLARRLVSEGTKDWDKADAGAVDTTGLQPTTRKVPLAPVAAQSVTPEDREPRYALQLRNGDYIYVDTSKSLKGYSDREYHERYRFFVGKPDRMVETQSIYVRSYLDGGTTFITTPLGELYLPPMSEKEKHATWNGRAVKQLEIDEALIAKLGVYSRTQGNSINKSVRKWLFLVRHPKPLISDDRWSSIKESVQRRFQELLLLWSRLKLKLAKMVGPAGSPITAANLPGRYVLKEVSPEGGIFDTDFTMRLSILSDGNLAVQLAGNGKSASLSGRWTFQDGKFVGKISGGELSGAMMEIDFSGFTHDALPGSLLSVEIVLDGDGMVHAYRIAEVAAEK